MPSVSLSETGLALIGIGFLLAFVAMILLIVSNLSGKGKVRGGGLLLLGPFPIVFGTDRESVKILMILALIIIVLLVAAATIIPRFLGAG